MKAFASEVDLAKAVASWAESRGWCVYKEVYTRGGDMDLLLVQDRVMWCIETKLALTPKLLVQCRERLGYAHYVSAAVPYLKSDVDEVKQMWLDHYGIGVLLVRDPEDCRYSWRSKRLDKPGSHSGTTVQTPEVNWGIVVREEIEPRVLRPNDLYDRRWRPSGKSDRHVRVEALTEVRASLREAHKHLIAGAPNGSQMTPWKITLNDVKDCIRKWGPQTKEELLQRVDYHWSKASAKRGLHQMLTEFAKKDFKQIGTGKDAKWALTEDGTREGVAGGPRRRSGDGVV